MQNGFLKLGEQKDLTINLRHVMRFGKDPFEILILNTGTIVRNMSEFVDVAELMYRWMYEGKEKSYYSK